MADIKHAARAISLIEDLEPFKEDLTSTQRTKLLAIALNFPERPGAAHPYQCCTPTDLEELEAILKQHYRP